MTHFIARHDAALKARVISSVEMLYSEGPSEDDDRPPHVLAASGLSMFREYLAVIQDDANWLALIDGEQRVSAVPLPPGPDGARVFTKSRGNQDGKCDLEACIAVPGDHGLELIGFGSGSALGREWILRVREHPGARREDVASSLSAELLRVEAFYAMLRGRIDFCGSGLNVEGAVALEDETILLFQRGNAEPDGDLRPVDAIARLRWGDLKRYLDDPAQTEPPQLRQIDTYDLGELDGVRLTFSDAEDLGRGGILYSASAEDPQTHEVAGSILGVLELDGSARWTELCDIDGGVFDGKIEGLTRDVADPRKVHFVIDDDDDEVPSKVFQAVLNEAFCQPL